MVNSTRPVVFGAVDRIINGLIGRMLCRIWYSHILSDRTSSSVEHLLHHMFCEMARLSLNLYIGLVIDIRPVLRGFWIFLCFYFNALLMYNYCAEYPSGGSCTDGIYVGNYIHVYWCIYQFMFYVSHSLVPE